jgi:hypothetical protein
MTHSYHRSLALKRVSVKLGEDQPGSSGISFSF